MEYALVVRTSKGWKYLATTGEVLYLSDYKTLANLYTRKAHALDDYRNFLGTSAIKNKIYTQYAILGKGL